MPDAALRHRLGGRRAHLVWAIGVLAYGVAVFHRSSLGVAGLEAAERFGVGASALAAFSMVQLLVYAAMQVPVGALLDRFGSRRLLLAGATLMAGGQLLFALADELGPALLARILLGVGDAMTFTAVLRLVVFWFPPHRNPLMAQLTGTIGQLGALASALPLVQVLQAVGWTPAYAGAAVLGLLVAVLVLLVLRDTPYESSGAVAPLDWAVVRGQLRLAWREPGTQLGLWSHFVTPFSAAAFLLLWGYPFLVTGQGLSPQEAGLLLGTLTLGGIACGPVLGLLVARHPFHRSRLVLGIVALTAGAWTVVLLWPGRAPLPVLIGLIAVLAVGGPASMIGFDYARSFNPVQRVSSASGIVNVGGFVAALVTIALVGVVLDQLTPAGAASSLDAYRWALAVQYPLWLLGATQVWRYRERTRRELAEHRPEAYAAIRRGQTVQPLP